ncbi:hypothetical protein Emtol_3478 [Emticicia oligotrophica DSM 17448]|jgi:hypothetical protein|uniref:Uncharacterized protein n=1 Tax=Emticicia oligotrophica (strain DSM 17448 / CIP 109782 / MTCC 6937 / GPTSA100-15) TaxID=929562 RepID=A0ABM5N517_EMTOG|nr:MULTISPECIES: hypothetical protein [Emticicia]AFK04606.1 hypothetical protein Emtol_3478 [Emticicia oligotrophica DSM 17448]
MNDGTKFKRMLGGILAGMGLLLLLFACVAFMSTNDTVMGLAVKGARKIAPAVLGIILLVSGVSMVNRT